jgi:hypothetical protein
LLQSHADDALAGIKEIKNKNKIKSRAVMVQEGDRQIPAVFFSY